MVSDNLSDPDIWGSFEVTPSEANATPASLLGARVIPIEHRSDVPLMQRSVGPQEGRALLGMMHVGDTVTMAMKHGNMTICLRGRFAKSSAKTVILISAVLEFQKMKQTRHLISFCGNKMSSRVSHRSDFCYNPPVVCEEGISFTCFKMVGE